LNASSSRRAWREEALMVVGISGQEPIAAGLRLLRRRKDLEMQHGSCSRLLRFACTTAEIQTRPLCWPREQEGTQFPALLLSTLTPMSSFCPASSTQEPSAEQHQLSFCCSLPLLQHPTNNSISHAARPVLVAHSCALFSGSSCAAPARQGPHSRAAAAADTVGAATS
jgi:hypothetical protein